MIWSSDIRLESANGAKMFKIKCMAVIALLISTLVVSFDAQARGRHGSHRAYPGHGKGSHYVGGH